MTVFVPRLRRHPSGGSPGHRQRSEAGILGEEAERRLLRLGVAEEMVRPQQSRLLLLRKRQRFVSAGEAAGAPIEPDKNQRA